MKTLVAGSWLSECGWEVMTWVPAIRKYSRKFDKTVIVCRTGHWYLYEDFADGIINYDKKGLPDRWLLNGKKVKLPKIIRRIYPDATFVEPSRKVCTTWKREFFKYGEKKEECTYDLVIHARACTKYNQRSWNWPKPRYRKVIEALKLERVCSIGTEAHYIEGTEDKRNIGLKELCNILASSKVCIGTSSGILHLASMCGCPHIVFTWDKWQKAIKGTNKDRYVKIWNPLQTPVKVLQGKTWHPSVEKVINAVEKMLIR